ncbi:MAG: Lon-like protease [Actinomycetota bacterium]|jgi:PDZ domain-containing protein|nr:Lon-like protease [Actinomycetota bacterium]
MDTERTATAPGAGSEPGFEGPVGGPSPRRIPLSARIGLGVALVLVAAVIAGFAIRVPYTTIAPGDALSLPPLVSVQGAKAYPAPRGDIRLLFVRLAYHVNLWQYVRARLDSDIDLAKDGDINPGKLSPTQQNERDLQEMADAKDAATVVALRTAGYKVSVLPGLTVSDLSPGMPAIKVLHWGDVVVSADGHKIVAANDLTVAIAKHKVGEQVSLVVERAGKQLSVAVKLGVFTDGPAQGHKGIGVSLLPRFTSPVKVAVDTRDIGGPSAGLAMTLAIVDDLTPGDITGGNRVAVTGTIDSAGNVGEIGGIEQKAVAARAAGVKLFIVPQCSPDDQAAALASCKADLARAGERAGGKIEVKPVSTFAQALEALRVVGGAAVTPNVPTSSSTVAA